MPNMKWPLVVLGLCAAAVSAAQRPGDKIVHELDALAPPELGGSAASGAELKKWYASLVPYLRKRDALVLKLFQADPGNPRTADLMVERWRNLGSEIMAAAAQSAKANDSQAMLSMAIQSAPKVEKAVDEDIDRILVKNPPPAIREVATYMKIGMSVSLDRTRKPSLTPIRAFVKKYPRSKHSPELLYQATLTDIGLDEKQALYREILKEYPNSPEANAAKSSLARG